MKDSVGAKYTSEPFDLLQYLQILLLAQYVASAMPEVN